MSQNKTVFPGMDTSRETGAHYDDRDVSSSIYSRGYDGANKPRGTVIPGAESPRNAAPAAAKAAKQPARNYGKPIVGFIYSISRIETGEYWPLYVGQNTIGQSSKCDICLREATVSQEHAVLVIRKMKKPEKVIASISDARSTNGTMINGESLGFTAVECHNGDILTFGESYEFVLILIDVKELGLKPSDNFISTGEADDDVTDDSLDYEDFPPRFKPEADRASKSTVGIDDTDGYPSTGGHTMGM